MNQEFVVDLVDRLSDDYHIELIEQNQLKETLLYDMDNFPMICFEHTDDSSFEVQIDESNFINSIEHDGTWVAGYDNDHLLFLLCLKESMDTDWLIMDTLEVSKEYRTQGIGKNIVNKVEESAKSCFSKIYVYPFDTNAYIFWTYMDYQESSVGLLKKMYNGN